MASRLKNISSSLGKKYSPSFVTLFVTVLRKFTLKKDSLKVGNPFKTGEGEIRTLGIDYSIQHLSRVPP